MAATSPSTALPKPGYIIDRSELEINETRFENDYFEISEGIISCVFIRDAIGKYQEQDVAIKILKCQRIPQIVTEFKHEIEVLSKLEPHPNIVKFYGASVTSVCRYFIYIFLCWLRQTCDILLCTHWL